MRFSDVTLGAIFLIIGLALGWYSLGLPAIPGQQYGAATFPLFISAGLIACSLRLLYTGIRSGNAPLVYIPEEFKDARAVLGALVTILLVVFYILFSRTLGFIPTAVIISFVMFLIFRVKPITAAVIAVVAAFACDFIFRTLLLVPLPFGPMPRLPW
jgi:putative tricarboxylic transport membrane protein